MDTCKTSGIVNSLIRRSRSDDTNAASSSKAEKWKQDPEIVEWVSRRGPNEKRKKAANVLSSSESRPRVDLQNMGLKDVPQSLMSIPVKATRLSLAGNNFSTLPVLVHLTYLKKLNASANLLVRVPPEIALLQNLESLDLSSNAIKAVPHEVGSLRRLKRLDFSENALVSDGLPESLANLGKLEELNLHGNTLKDVPRSFKNLQKLVKLDLSSNHFEILPMEVAQIESLQELNVANNALKKIPQGGEGGGELYKSLKMLNVSGNPLVWLPGDFGPLQYVSVSRFIVTKQKRPNEFSLSTGLRIDISNTPLPINTSGGRIPMLTGAKEPPEPRYLPLYQPPRGEGAAHNTSNDPPAHVPPSGPNPAQVPFGANTRFAEGPIPATQQQYRQPEQTYQNPHGAEQPLRQPQPDAFASTSHNTSRFGRQPFPEPQSLEGSSDEEIEEIEVEDNPRMRRNHVEPTVELPPSDSGSGQSRRRERHRFSDASQPNRTQGAPFQNQRPPQQPFQAQMPPPYQGPQFQMPAYQPGFQTGQYNMPGQQPGVLPQAAAPQLHVLNALRNMTVAPPAPFLQSPTGFFQPARPQTTLFNYLRPPLLSAGIGRKLIINNYLEALLKTHPLLAEGTTLDKLVRVAKRGTRPTEDLKNLGIMLFQQRVINDEALKTAQINSAAKKNDPVMYGHRETDARRIALAYQTIVASELQIDTVIDIRKHWDDNPNFSAFFESVVSAEMIGTTRAVLLNEVGQAQKDVSKVESFIEQQPFWQAHSKEQIESHADTWQARMRRD
jgi:Leucine rich repeat